MDLGMAMFYLISGIAMGAILMRIFYGLRPYDGTLRIDQTDPEKDIYRLEFDVDPEYVKSRRIVRFMVDANAHLRDDPVYREKSR